VGLYLYYLTSSLVTKTSSRYGVYVEDHHHHVIVIIIIIIIIIILSSNRSSGLLQSPAIFLEVFLLTVVLRGRNAALGLEGWSVACYL
jgi:hypothetical protein